MSYCRFIENDAYVFESDGGFITCCGCLLSGSFLWSGGEGDPKFTSRHAVIAHLNDHVHAGHQIQSYVFERLREEIASEGDEVRERDYDRRDYRED